MEIMERVLTRYQNHVADHSEQVRNQARKFLRINSGLAIILIASVIIGAAIWDWKCAGFPAKNVVILAAWGVLGVIWYTSFLASNFFTLRLLCAKERKQMKEAGIRIYGFKTGGFWPFLVSTPIFTEMKKKRRRSRGKSN